MNQIMKRFATGMAWSLVVLGAITFTAVPEASAHGVTKIRYVDYDYYVYKRSTQMFPRWLRAKRDFHRWYFRSHYRNMRRLSWQRLYDLYQYDTRRSRRSWRHKEMHDRYDRDHNGRHHRHRG